MLPGVTTGVDRRGAPGLTIRAATGGRSIKGPRTVRYLSGFGTGVRFGVHCDNLINMTRGIAERVLYVVRDGCLTRAPQPRVGVFNRLGGLRKRLFLVLRPTPVVPREDYPSLYNGRKRGIYERALESLKLRGISPRDAWVSTFLKAEKINFDSKGDPAPRVIQPRSPRYNLEVGRYLKLFEKRLFSGFETVFGYPVILKGMNAHATAEQLRSNWDSFVQPVAVGLDASRFDQHVSYEALCWEHSVYNGVFRSSELKRLLRWQLVNHGVARTDGHRIDYTTHGCRMSGDINTSLGNCLIMSSIVLAYCEDRGISARLSNNGDDCVLILESGQLGLLAGIDSWFLDFGFTLTREPAVRVFEKIEFCQQQPVLTGSGWRMVRNPFTAMSKDCVSLLSWDTEQDIQYWAHAIGSCGLSLTSGVPVWEEWYKRLLRLGREAPAGVQERINESGMYYMSVGVPAAEVTPEARVSFFRAFGVAPDMQEALEHEYSSTFEMLPLCPMTSSHVKANDIHNNTLAAWHVAKQCQIR